MPGSAPALNDGEDAVEKLLILPTHLLMTIHVLLVSPVCREENSRRERLSHLLMVA